MGEDIIRAVCSSIHSTFGKDCRIYTEKVEQGFKRPSFFVERTGGCLELFRGSRYYMKNPILITYYPPYEGRKGEMTRVGEMLAACLGYIDIEGDKLMGSGPVIENEGDCLKCRVSYDFYVIIKDKEEAAELMKEYELLMKGGCYD